ncbi:MAG TPA: Gfo/Idh/MocA family oxidoreductase [Tepidisphaeraceae bacterium]|nr:Gfo/Idh/MocA family oxidoreductase [Tepidisphaeraceae bacterium]
MSDGGAVAAGERLKVGIVGFGRIGAEHAAWLRQCGGAEPAGAFDPTPARRALAEQHDGLRTFDSLDALLGDASVQAVLISTPTARHFEQASAALRAGKHVMVEKPMALDAREAAALVDLAERERRVLGVFHNRRWDLDYLTLCRAIASGTLGRVLNVESRIGQWASCVGPAAKEWRPGWRNEAGFGGGGLYDWGSHFLDQLWRMMLPARPIRAFAQLRGNVWASDCDDLARVCVDFDNGAVGLVEINTTTTRPLPRWHVDGTAGSAESPYSLAFDLQTWARLTFTPAPGEGYGGDQQLDVVDPGGVLTEPIIWDRFASATRGEGEPAVTARSVLPTMILLDAARQSSQTGAAVPIDASGWTR